MEFQLEDAMAILSRTPATLNALLAGAPAAWVTGNEGQDTWSPYDVLGHLIHGEETDWIPRALIILEHGEAKAFEPFDRFAQERKSRDKTIEDLLGEFLTLRTKNLETLSTLGVTAEHLALRGTHPELGTVTLGQLLATWVAHDLSHVAQTLRVMSRQYTEAVGPWRQYLPILA